MSTRRPLVISALTLIVVFAASMKAEADRMLVTDLASSAVRCDATIPEPAPGATESPLECDVLLQGYGGGDLITAVILTAPAGAPPGENPVLVPGTNLVAGALIIMNIFTVLFPTDFVLQLLYFSDGSSDFGNLVSSYGPFASLLEATGSLQDVTYLLHSDLGGTRVQVQSDVIPEPATGALVMAGLLGLAYRQRRTARAGIGSSGDCRSPSRS
jgi:hypothetical protein